MPTIRRSEAHGFISRETAVALLEDPAFMPGVPVAGRWQAVLDLVAPEVCEDDEESDDD